MKLNVPKDVSLICFNDVFPVAQVHPPITSIAVSGRDIRGYIAMLMDLPSLTALKSLIQEFINRVVGPADPTPTT